MKIPGEKQIKVIQDQGQLKTIKKYAYESEDLSHLSQNEMKYLINL